MTRQDDLISISPNYNAFSSQYLRQLRDGGEVKSRVNSAQTGDLLKNVVLLRFMGEEWAGGHVQRAMRTEVLKDMVAERAADSATNGIVEAFDDSTGEAFVEVAQEFIPPMLKV